jgi:hypothetical protein
LFADGDEERLREIAARQDKEGLNRTLRKIKSAQATTAAQLRTVDLRSRVHLIHDLVRLPLSKTLTAAYVGCC